MQYSGAETQLSSNVRQDMFAQPAIEVQDLYKVYGRKQAVNGVGFHVNKGEIFGLLGPNGAGKTTTLEMIEGLRKPDMRETTRIMVDGLNVLQRRQRNELHQRIGLQLQASSLFEELTVGETLHMLTRLYRKSRTVKDLIHEFDLQEKVHARIDTLSGGQKQRLALAAALVNDPSTIFLDEPTTALDPHARRSMWEKIRELQHAGKTIVVTTHYMEEAEILCDRIAIMNAGKIIALDTPAKLIEHYAKAQTISLRLAHVAALHNLQTDLQTIPGVLKVVATANGFQLTTSNVTTTLATLLHVTEKHQAPLTEIVTHAPSLEDVYLNLTGHTLQD